MNALYIWIQLKHWYYIRKRNIIEERNYMLDIIELNKRMIKKVTKCK